MDASTIDSAVRVPGRASKHAARLKTDDGLCAFCQRKAAAVTVRRPMPHRRKKRAPQSLCLLHYYSTSAVREDPSQHVSVSDEQEVQTQLPEMQQLFAEAFVNLQQKLQEETARSFAAHADDPLAILTDIHHRRSSKKPPPPAKRKTNEQHEGGFLRHVPLPERLIHTQQAQARQQEALLQRMKQASSSSSSSSSSTKLLPVRNKRTKIDTSQRRKSSRKSIWNTILEEDKQKPRTTTKETFEENDMVDVPPCSCGSQNVQQLGSHTSRNQDMAKGETWGTKDRGDDVIARYQCLQCGKMWNQEA